MMHGRKNIKLATFMSNKYPSFQNSISVLIFLSHFMFLNLGSSKPVFKVTWQLKGVFLNKAAYMKLPLILRWPCLWSDRLTDSSLRPTNGGWIPGREKKFISSTKRPGRIWRPPSHPVHWIPEEEGLGREHDHLPPVLARLSTSWATPPLPHMTFNCAQIHLSFKLLLT